VCVCVRGCLCKCTLTHVHRYTCTETHMCDIETESAKIAVECALFVINDNLSMTQHTQTQHTENIWGVSTLLPSMEYMSVCQKSLHAKAQISQSDSDTKNVQFKLQCTEKLLGDVVKSINDINIALLQIKRTVNEAEVTSLQQKSKLHNKTKHIRSQSI
jgi:hypothetical protein